MSAANVERHEPLPVDVTLRGVVIVFRLLGLAWMAMLVIATLSTDPEADEAIALGALALATVWTLATIIAARNPSDPIRTPWFVFADGVVAILVASSSFWAGAEHLFHGGYPISWIVVAAYAGGLRYAMWSALVLFAQQVVMYAVEAERGLIPTLGNIVFVVFAIVVGWAVDALRVTQRARLEAERQVAAARAEQARHEERASLANRLHDSYLQTLHVIRRDADDADEVRYLARRQERELRRVIDTMRSPFEHSFAARLLEVRDEVEDLFRIQIHVVNRDDAEMTEELQAAIDAAHEAMTNAAKHAGVDEIDVYAEISDGSASIFVRDRGSGFSGDIPESGLDHSVRSRIEAVGGTVVVTSEPGSGTEVAIKVEERVRKHDEVYLVTP
jgi:signal transduction histidine kinase